MPNNFVTYLTSSFMLQGALLALEIAGLAMAAGLILGLGLALLRLSRSSVLSGIAWFYIWFMRGTPLLLQLVFIFDVLPAVGLTFGTFTTAVVGFSLNEAAFTAEIIRGGILSVNRSQSTAATALGMPPLLTLRRIILPQAMRAILPALANQTISLIKGTSIASVIFVNELTLRAEQIVAQNFRFFQVFTAAGLIYLTMTSAVAVAQLAAERRFDFMRDDRTGISGRLLSIFGRSKPAEPAAEPRPEPPRERLPTLIAGICRDLASTNAEPCVVCRNVQKSYGTREVLKSIDMTVHTGEVVVIMGPSGSGKSTLLRLINHLEPLGWGEITVHGIHVGYEKIPGGGLRPTRRLAQARAKARIGMVFQHFNLFEHLTTLENVIEAPVTVYHEPPDDARAIGLRLLAAVGLARHAEHFPHQLSGGQQQRVAIARALAVSPRVMLFDEPTSALDPELVGEVLAVIRGLAEAGMTMIIVTHEVRFARDVADRILFMDDGLIVEQGAAEQVLDRPVQERTRRFLRMVNKIEEEIV
ncbi:amino acid ABC transporter permease/ATP-binding protein [Rhodopila sp.]|uniref:amino acid ABC transporter permease/ATP-binding protein n=1 Tax=Rhodopila sp. TaxID=2480087 RepID=UPI003D129DCB